MITSKVLVGVVAGAVAGAALAILFAPHKGSKPFLIPFQNKYWFKLF